MTEIYLDNSATTKAASEVTEAMMTALRSAYGNPSSAHRKGLEAERLVRHAARTIADAIGVNADSVVFTSGGTESNNLALLGAARVFRRYGQHIITTAIEHPSVLGACDYLAEHGYDVTYLEPDASGRVSAEAVTAALRPDTTIVSVMLVNNEVGSIQPIAAIGEVLKRHRQLRRLPLLHVDAVQALGKVPVRPSSLGADLVSLSAHKIHGPKGVGALYVRPGLQLEPLLFGGGQQRGLRPGTENVPGIAGFGKAVELAMTRLDARGDNMLRLRRHLLAGLAQKFPEVRINGPLDDEHAAPHIVNFSFPGIPAEVLVHALADQGIYVSNGSACHSRRGTVSHVIEAIKVPGEYAKGAIRVGFSRESTSTEVDQLLTALSAIVPSLAAIAMRRG